MIPERYQKAEYEQVPEEIRAKFGQIKKTRRGLYIYGDVGTGKTHIAYAMLKKWQEVAGYEAKFCNMPELVNEIRADFDRLPLDKSRIDERINDYNGLLFLDDVGAEKITDWVAEKFYLIINRRYSQLLPVIITSNLSIAELAEKVGDRTASRIVEMCDIIFLEGKDRRVENIIQTKVKI